MHNKCLKLRKIWHQLKHLSLYIKIYNIFHLYERLLNILYLMGMYFIKLPIQGKCKLEDKL